MRLKRKKQKLNNIDNTNIKIYNYKKYVEKEE